jgi:acylphosphatase
MDENQARRYFVSGTVQGVGYRFFAQRVAEELGLCGYVCNLPDGRVEALAIGTPAQLAKFRAELERGPGAAFVSRVTEQAAAPEPRYARDFTIL